MFLSYECDLCGQTTTDQAIKSGDIVDIKLDCWACVGGVMTGFVTWDEVNNPNKPTASFESDDKVKITLS